MKKLLFISALALVFGQVFTSCKGNEPEGPEKYEDYPYSSLTPEKQKEKLAQESDAILNKLADLPNLKGIDVVEAFTELWDIYGEDEPSYNVDPSDNAYDQIMKRVTSDEKVIYIKDIFGQYTWNAAEQDWDKTELANKAVFIFPVPADNKTNNGKIEITGTGSGVIEDGSELPKNMKITLYLDNATVGNMDYQAEGINVETIADKASLKISMDNYLLDIYADKNAQGAANGIVKFSKGSDVILDATMGANVTFEKEYDYIEPVLGYTSYEVKIGSNLAVAGYIDVKNLDIESDKLEEKYEKQYGEYWKWNDEVRRAYVVEDVAIQNKYTKLYLVSRDDKTKIADLTFDYREYRYGTQVEYSVKEVLVFGDNTKVDMDVYFSEGFEKVEKAWIAFFEKFGLGVY